MRLRYYSLTDHTEFELIKEIKKRQLNAENIVKHFDQIKFYKYQSTRFCPCCGNSNYIKRSGDKVTECMVCGFNRTHENPGSIVTKIRWGLGIYFAIQLSKSEFLKLIRQQKQSNS